MITINNLPAYALDHEFIVARYADGAWWFFGAWDNKSDANRVAWYEDCEVFHIDEIRV